MAAFPANYVEVLSHEEVLKLKEGKIAAWLKKEGESKGEFQEKDNKRKSRRKLVTVVEEVDQREVGDGWWSPRGVLVRLATTPSEKISGLQQELGLTNSEGKLLKKTMMEVSASSSDEETKERRKSKRKDFIIEQQEQSMELQDKA
eukprot:CAMPEP_0174274756 /NCGR_PEP_ID=MMETSP0439-20130205/59161_1 /TAXON_ID=0 /ORGANISM="Stereomyxa ramosa, Strain Chinc5" /LENGTH=145 /DNA_ID=CAMNT_0015366741 /DNA_START=204 /DNA_END=638 /DNA_ORIENTATION=+